MKKQLLFVNFKSMINEKILEIKAFSKRNAVFNNLFGKLKRQFFHIHGTLKYFSDFFQKFPLCY